jgi:hypothetical protein
MAFNAAVVSLPPITLDLYSSSYEHLQFSKVDEPRQDNFEGEVVLYYTPETPK